jgi:hypothetical protein
MPDAAMLSLEEFRATQQRAAIRQRLHDGFDCWLNRLEDQVQSPNPCAPQKFHPRGSGHDITQPR